MSLLEKLRTKTAKLTAAIGLGLMSVLPKLQADKLVETGTYNNGSYTITVTDDNTVEQYWEDNPHQNWTLDTYLKTINREAVLERLEQEKTMLDKAEEVVSELGIESPLPEDFSLSKGVEIFSPEYDLNFQNWDVYLHQSGSFIGSAKIYFAKIINFVPSNVPEITDINFEKIPEGIFVALQTTDETTYDKIKEQVEAELPFWKLRINFPPQNKDLTCYLGPTKDPDLIHWGTFTNLETNESTSKSAPERPGIGIFLPNENYKVEVKVIDEVGNESPLVSRATTLEEIIASQEIIEQEKETTTNNFLDDLILYCNEGIYVTTLDGTHNKKLTDFGGLPKWLKNKEQILIFTYSEGFYIMNADGTELERLSPALDIDSTPLEKRVSLSPQKDKILFVVDRDDKPGKEVYILNINNQTIRWVTQENNYDYQKACLLPDGKKIIAIAFNEETSEYIIHTMDVYGKNIKELIRFQDWWHPYYWFDLAPNGKKIGVLKLLHPEGNRLLPLKDNRRALYTFDIDGTNMVKLFPPEELDRSCVDPIWSQDSNKIAFHTDMDHNAWVVDVNTRELIKLADTNHPYPGCKWSFESEGLDYAYIPIDWSPKGEYIICQEGIHRSRHVIIDAKTGEFIRELPTPSRTYGVDW